MKILLCCLLIVIVLTLTSSSEPTVEEPIRQRKDMMIYAPVPHVPTEARLKHLAGNGIFLFHVRPDGTVANVEVIQSTGHKILDDVSVEAFSKWRFKPGTPPRVKLPVTYTGKYRIRAP